jgi:hypothetical protein
MGRVTVRSVKGRKNRECLLYILCMSFEEREKASEPQCHQARLWMVACSGEAACELRDGSHPNPAGGTPQGREVGRPFLPRTTPGTAQPREWQLGLPTMLTSAMTVVAQQPEPQQLIAWLHQGQEEGIGQRCQHQQFLTGFAFLVLRSSLVQIKR